MGRQRFCHPHDDSSPWSGYPWQGALQQRLRPFDRPLVLSVDFPYLSSPFSLRYLLLLLSGLSGRDQFALTFGLDGLGTSFEFVQRRDITDGAV